MLFNQCVTRVTDIKEESGGDLWPFVRSRNSSLPPWGLRTVSTPSTGCGKIKVQGRKSRVEASWEGEGPEGSHHD